MIRMGPREVRDARKRLGLTQELFAQDVGVTSRQVRNWENPMGLGASRTGSIAIRRLLEREAARQEAST